MIDKKKIKKQNYLLFIIILASITIRLANAFNSRVNSVIVDSNDKILAGGFFADGLNLDFAIAKYNTDGSLDTTFNPTGGQPGITVTSVQNNDLVINSIKIDANNKIIAGGYIQNNQGTSFIVARYNGDGTLDTTFNQNGLIPGLTITPFDNNNAFINSIAIDFDNNIIAAGYIDSPTGQSIALAKYINNSLPANNQDGNLDITFNPNALSPVVPGTLVISISSKDKANGVIIDNNDQIVICGSTSDSVNQEFLVARLNQDGSFDTSFNSTSTTPGIFITTIEGSNNSAKDLKTDIFNNIIVAGNGVDLQNNTSAYIIIELTEDGTLNTDFNTQNLSLGTPGIIFSNFPDNSVQANSLALDANDNIVITGSFLETTTTTSLFTARYRLDGSIDTTFSPLVTPGYVITPVIDQNSNVSNQIIFSQANGVIIDSTSNIIISGFSGTTISNFTTAKYISNGTLDITFNPTSSQQGVLITNITNGITNTQEIYLPGGPEYDFNRMVTDYPNPEFYPEASQNLIGYTKPVITNPTSNFNTNEIRPKISGIAQPKSEISIYVDETAAGQTISDYLGSWNFELPELPDGDHEIFVTARDPLSNLILTSDPIKIYINTQGPEKPTISTPKNNLFFNKRKIEVAGTAPNSSLVAIYINSELKKTVKTNENGTWNDTIENLVDGKYVINVVSSDELGNLSEKSDEKIFYIDTKAPQKPVILTPKTGATYNQKNIIIEGTSKPYQKIEIFLNKKSISKIEATQSGKWNLHLNNLPNKNFTVYAQTKDTITNKILDSEKINFSVKTELIKKDSEKKVNKNIKEETTQAKKSFLSGTASPNDTVSIFIDDKKVGESKADKNGFWNFNLSHQNKLTSNLKEGQHKVSIYSKNKLQKNSTKPKVIIQKNVNITKETLEPK